MPNLQIDSGYFPWSPITERKRLNWPNEAKLAVCFLVHVEAADFLPPEGSIIPRTLTHRPPYPKHPDVHEVTPREYGNRVGIFRVFEALDKHGFRASAPIDGVIADQYSPLVNEIKKREWEVLAHGPISSRALSEKLSEDYETEYISSSIQSLTKAFGVKPAGWASVDYMESSRTVRLLAEQGFEYVADWANDEQPYEMQASGSSITSLPISIHLDDVFAHRKRGLSMDRWARMVIESFDRLLQDGQKTGLTMVLGLHPWLIGHPFRIRYLEHVLDHIAQHQGVWVATGNEIVTEYRKQLKK